MAGQVRGDECFARAGEEWHCRFCSETNVWSKCRRCRNRQAGFQFGELEDAKPEEDGKMEVDDEGDSRKNLEKRKRDINKDI